MNLSAPFIRRPVATTLLTIGLLAAGLVALSAAAGVAAAAGRLSRSFRCRPHLPGASPEVVATTVASAAGTPSRRNRRRHRDDFDAARSASTRITLQFDLNRDIDGAARDVQAAINAARADLPTSLRTNPTYRKVNPADAPIMILALTSDTLPQGQALRRRHHHSGAEALPGGRHRRGDRGRQLAAGGARRAEPAGALQIRHRTGRRARGTRRGQRPQPQGRDRRSATSATRSMPTTRRTRRTTTAR